MNSIYTIITMITLAATGGTRNAGDDVAQIISKTKALYQSTASAQINFSQAGDAGAFSGSILYTKGNKFRMQIPGQTIVSDGAHMWTYTVARKQVVITKATSQGNRLTPNDVFTLFPGDYTPRLNGEGKVDGVPVWIVECTASASGRRIGDISRAVLSIDKRSYRFRQIMCQSPSMGSVTLRITQARYDVKVTPQTFTFTPPNGVRVVDLSK